MKRTLAPSRLARPNLPQLALCAALSAVCAAASAQVVTSADTPTQWPMYALNPGHNAVVPSHFPAMAWTWQVPGAADAAKAKVLNPTIIRDLVGFPIGVAVVDGMVYATNDNGYIYAVDARSGKLAWSFNAYNQLMSTPIVASIDGRPLVFIGAGNSVFAYSHAKRFGVPGAQVIRGNGVSAIYALDAKTGDEVWVYKTKGEDMPTPALYQGKLLFGNGDGHAYALDAASGKLAWRTPIHSFVSMSSATLDPARGVLVMGGTHPSKIYGLDAATGKLLWSVEPPLVFSSSAGDGTWAMDGKGLAVGQIETRTSAQKTTKESASEELAIDVKTGKIVWSTELGAGKTPPRNKDAVPTVVDGVVYTGSPVTHSEYAVDAQTGRIVWQQPLKGGMKGAPGVVGKGLIQATASGEIFTLDRDSGAVLHTYNAHQGGYGPQNGVVVGGTYFNGTNAGMLQAIPLSTLGVTGKP